MAKEKPPHTSDGHEASIAYRGLLFELVRHPQASGKVFEIARRGPGTRLLLTSSDEKLLLTREYRTELGDHDYRLPGGKVFDALADYEAARSSGTPLQEFARQGAIRELEEETGYMAESLDFLAISKCGATIEWDLYYFACTHWQPPVGPVANHDDEDITVVWESFATVHEMCLRGIISEERSAMQILRYIQNRRER